MNLLRELFSTEETGCCCLSYDAGEWMPARLGKAWLPRGGNGRVMIYLAFGLENDFLRYRIAVVCHEEDASSGFSGNPRQPGESDARARTASSVERRTVAKRARASW